jgi:hypothetical protein
MKITNALPSAWGPRPGVRRGERPTRPASEFVVLHHIPEGEAKTIIHFGLSEENTGRRIAASRGQSPEAYLANLLRVAIAADYLSLRNGGEK